MRKILCTVLKWPKATMEGEVVHLTLEKSGVALEVDAFVAHEQLGSDGKDLVLEARGADTALRYGDKSLKLASCVITCWLPNAERLEGSALLWIDR
jgi:hypothetical protein